MINVDPLDQTAPLLNSERHRRPPRLQHRRVFRKAAISRNHSQPSRQAHHRPKSRPSSVGPIGETIRATGPAATENVFRFSAKYTDPETGLIYYGYRYYQPSTGRWLSRDPVEYGSLGLYAFVDSDPLNWRDPFGDTKQGNDSGKDVGKHAAFELVTENGQEFVKVTLKAGAVGEAAASAAKAKISTALTLGKTAIEQSSATSGGLTQFPKGLADKLGSGLKNVGDSVKIPKSVFASAGIAGALDLYNYVTWVQGGAMEKLTKYEEDFSAFLKSKTYDNCLVVCFSAADFIGSVPACGQDSIAGFFLYHCSLSCCKY